MSKALFLSADKGWTNCVSRPTIAWLDTEKNKTATKEKPRCRG